MLLLAMEALDRMLLGVHKATELGFDEERKLLTLAKKSLTRCFVVHIKHTLQSMR